MRRLTYTLAGAASTEARHRALGCAERREGSRLKRPFAIGRVVPALPETPFAIGSASLAEDGLRRFDPSCRAGQRTQAASRLRWNNEGGNVEIRGITARRCWRNWGSGVGVKQVGGSPTLGRKAEWPTHAAQYAVSAPPCQKSAMAEPRWRRINHSPGKQSKTRGELHYGALCPHGPAADHADQAQYTAGEQPGRRRYGHCGYRVRTHPQLEAAHIG
jgi:hypothetical protein